MPAERASVKLARRKHKSVKHFSRHVCECFERRHSGCKRCKSHDDDQRGLNNREGNSVDAMFAGQAATEVGRLLGRVVTPREITALFYDRAVPEDLGPVVGGRRMIRPEAVQVIVAALREKDAARQQPERGDSCHTT